MTFPIGVPISLAEGLVSAYFVRPRSIDSFVADVTIEELHTDELIITDNPVEQGATISDHAYKRPVRVNIHVGYSNSSLSSILNVAALGSSTYVNEIYAEFLALQASRRPFDIVTGKRSYQNMLIERMTERTDKHTENAMILVVECREVILVNTQTVIVPDASVMKTPQSNGAIQNNGATQLLPGTSINVPSTSAFFG